MVEFSIIGVLFFVLLIGIVDFGQFLFVQQGIVERARYAARWGALNDPGDSTAIQNVVLYMQPTVPTGAVPAFGLTSSNVTVTTADAGTDNYRLMIKISSYKLTTLSPYLAGSYTGPAINVTVPLGIFN